MRNWMNSMAVGTLVHVTTPFDMNRVGHCWMQGRLKEGDVLLVLAHTGDNFYDFCLVEVYGNAIRALPNTRFGAYALGELLGWQPNQEQMQDLFAGKSVPTEAVAAEATQLAKRVVQAKRDAIRNAGTGDVLQLPRAGLNSLDDADKLIGFVVENRMDDPSSPGMLMTFPDKTQFVDAKCLERATVKLQAKVTA